MGQAYPGFYGWGVAHCILCGTIVFYPHGSFGVANVLLHGRDPHFIS